MEWVNDALSMTTHATVRRHKIQPQDALRLVIGLSLLRQEPINNVAEQLAQSSKQLDNALLSAKSSLTAARQRLGVEPVQWLFQ
ncbi:transposase domain-containing protein [Vibrio sp. 10N.261.51.F12]|uniref:transposase domain-containing protein n=1 Tax=Vibrio sp. 10N.261.51.F12 TaxID=3229679 RepID=UPI00354DF90F